MSHKYVSNKAVMKNEGFLAKLGSTLMSRTNPDPLIETKTQSSITWRKTSEVKARIKTATGTIAIYDDMSPEEIAELEQQATMMAGGSAPELSGVAATAVQTAVLAAGIGQEEQETTTVATYLVVDDYSPDDSEGLAVVAGQKVILVDKSSPHKRPRLEGDESNTQLLDNSAARHKMAVRPKRNHPDPRSRAQEGSEDRWVVRDADSGKEGLVPSRFLALHSQETSTSLKASLKRSVQQLALEETLVVKKNLMKEIREFKSRKLSSKLLGPSPEDEARGKRTATIRELIETEEEFVKDLEFVMENYYNLMDKQTTPRNIRDHKELIFNNFKFIADFHQNVLIEGVKYHAEVPTMIGRTFLRLERDFDKHAEYCSNEPLAQEFLENNIPVKEYFEEYSQRLGDDKRLQEHLKLPIQRLNDYQLLLRELVKFSSRLGDDTTDLQRAYELMQTIPQRATDAKFISSIEGFKGNLFKLGRLLRHDWFSVKEAGEKARDRYLFLFKARILITKVKRIAEDRSVFILKDIIRLPETSLASLDKPKALEFFHIESLSHPNYPIFLEARTPEIRDSWLTGIQEYVVDTASVEDLLFDDELRVLSQDIDEEDAGVVSPVPEVQEFEDLPEDYEFSDQIHREFQVPIEREPSPPHKRQKPETQPLEGVQEAEAAKAGPEVSSQQKAAAEAASSPKAANQQAKGLTLEQVEAPEPSVVAEQGQAPTTTTASPPTTPKETQLAEQQDPHGTVDDIWSERDPSPPLKKAKIPSRVEEEQTLQEAQEGSVTTAGKAEAEGLQEEEIDIWGSRGSPPLRIRPATQAEDGTPSPPSGEAPDQEAQEGSVTTAGKAEAEGLQEEEIDIWGSRVSPPLRIRPATQAEDGTPSPPSGEAPDQEPIAESCKKEPEEADFWGPGYESPPLRIRPTVETTEATLSQPGEEQAEEEPRVEAEDINPEVSQQEEIDIWGSQDSSPPLRARSKIDNKEATRQSSAEEGTVEEPEDEEEQDSDDFWVAKDSPPPIRRIKIEVEEKEERKAELETGGEETRETYQTDDNDEDLVERWFGAEDSHTRVVVLESLQKQEEAKLWKSKHTTDVTSAAKHKFVEETEQEIFEQFSQEESNVTNIWSSEASSSSLRPRRQVPFIDEEEEKECIVTGTEETPIEPTEESPDEALIDRWFGSEETRTQVVYEIVTEEKEEQLEHVSDEEHLSPPPKRRKSFRDVQLQEVEEEEDEVADIWGPRDISPPLRRHVIEIEEVTPSPPAEVEIVEEPSDDGTAEVEVAVEEAALVVEEIEEIDVWGSRDSSPPLRRTVTKVEEITHPPAEEDTLEEPTVEAAPVAEEIEEIDIWGSRDSSPKLRRHVAKAEDTPSPPAEEAAVEEPTTEAVLVSEEAEEIDIWGSRDSSPLRRPVTKVEATVEELTVEAAQIAEEAEIDIWGLGDTSQPLKRPVLKAESTSSPPAEVVSFKEPTVEAAPVAEEVAAVEPPVEATVTEEAEEVDIWGSRDSSPPLRRAVTKVEEITPSPPAEIETLERPPVEATAEVTVQEPTAEAALVAEGEEIDIWGSRDSSPPLRRPVAKVEVTPSPSAEVTPLEELPVQVAPSPPSEEAVVEELTAEAVLVSEEAEEIDIWGSRDSSPPLRRPIAKVEVTPSPSAEVTPLEEPPVQVAPSPPSEEEVVEEPTVEAEAVLVSEEAEEIDIWGSRDSSPPLKRPAAKVEVTPPAEGPKVEDTAVAEKVEEINICALGKTSPPLKPVVKLEEATPSPPDTEAEDAGLPSDFWSRNESPPLRPKLVLDSAPEPIEDDIAEASKTSDDVFILFDELAEESKEHLPTGSEDLSGDFWAGRSISPRAESKPSQTPSELAEDVDFWARTGDESPPLRPKAAEVSPAEAAEPAEDVLSPEAASPNRSKTPEEEIGKDKEVQAVSQKLSEQLETTKAAPEPAKPVVEPAKSTTEPAKKAPEPAKPATSKPEVSKPELPKLVVPKAEAAKPEVKPEVKDKPPRTTKKMEEPTTPFTPGGTPKPVFTKTLRGDVVEPGEGVTFSCEVAHPCPYFVTWLKDAKPLDDKLADRVQQQDSGDRHNLRVMNCRIQDSGIYTAKATDEAGAAATCSAQLLVQELTEEERSRRISEKSPFFLVRMKPTEVIENTNLSYTIHVKGDPMPDVQFFKDDKEIKEDSRLRLHRDHASGHYELLISHVQRGDEGTYKCLARNKFGRAECQASMTVSDEDLVYESLSGKGSLLAKGEKAEFKWFRDGQEFDPLERFNVMFKDDEDTLALVFQNVTPEDAGLYTCVASTSCGKISCSAELTVEGSVNRLLRDPEPPSIKEQLTDTQVAQGGSAMLECKVGGFPKPDLQWTKNGLDVKSGGRFKFLWEDEESVALVIKNVEEKDAGLYRVVAKNELGEAQCSANLAIKAGPKIKSMKKEVACVIGQNLEYHVEVEGEPAPEVRWVKDGKPVVESDRIKFKKESDTLWTLKISSMQMDDCGCYTVVAVNSIGQVSEFFNLQTDAGPQITRGLDPETEKKLSNDLTLEVRATGSPKPDARWFKNGKEIMGDEKFKMVRDESFYMLKIRRLERKDKGTYKCELSNTSGTASTEGELIVRAPPDFITPLKDVCAKEGSKDVKLFVEWEANPKPSVKWFLNDKPIREETAGYTIRGQETTQVLTINEATPDFVGTYTVKASNEYGEGVCKGRFRLHEAPAITEGLKDVEFLEDSTSKFTFKATGIPLPEIKWTKDGKKWTPDERRVKLKVENEDTFSLVFEEAKPEDSGLYVATVSNVEGSTTTEGSIVVNTPPHIIKSNFRDGKTFIAMHKFLLEVEATAVPEAQATWYCNGKQLSEEENSVKFTFDGTKYTLERIGCDPEHSGEYKCVLKNKIKEVEEVGQVIVKEKESRVRNKLEDVFVKEFTDATIKCQIVGDPIPEVQWLRNGKPLPISEKYEVSCERMSGWHTLLVKDVQEADKCSFSIKGKNQHGECETSCRMGVLVKPQPGPLEDATVDYGRDLHLVVNIHAFPPPTMVWSLEGKELKHSEHFEYTRDEEKENYGLVIHSAVLEDAGKIAFTASNAAGSTPGSCTVKVHTEKPSVVGALENLDYCLEDNVTFTLRATGLPLPECHWKKNGVPLKEDSKHVITNPEPGVYCLTIKDLKPEDYGEITVAAKSLVGDCSSTSRLTQKKLACEVVEGLENVTQGAEGDDVTLTVKIRASPRPNFIWTKDGDVCEASEKIKIDIKKTSFCEATISLTLVEAGSVDSGQYRLKFSNEVNETSTETALIVRPVRRKPKVTKKPEDVEIMDGKACVLKAKITGFPKPEVKWMKDGHQVYPTDIVDTGVTAEGLYYLEFKVVNQEDAGRYTVVAANEEGAVEVDATLAVTPPPSRPEFLQSLKASKVILGYPVRMEVKLGGSPRPEVQWLKDGQPINIDGKHFKQIVDPDGTVSLQIDSATEGDMGEFTCVAKNAEGDSKSSATLSVLGFKREDGQPDGPARFSEGLKDMSFDEGQTIKLPVAMKGGPVPVMKWYKDGEEIKLGERAFFTYDGDRKQAFLEVRPAIGSDSGKYKCVIQNAHGSAETECEVGIRKSFEEPCFTSTFPNQAKLPGRDVKMSVKYDGVPLPELTWYFNGKPIVPDGEKFRIRREGDGQTLYLKECTYSDSGKYKVVAKNREGQIEHEAELEVADDVDPNRRAEAPVFLKAIGDQEVFEGSKALFKAIVVGRPEPEFKWFKNGSQVIGSNRVVIEKDLEGLIRLSIRHVTPEDSGVYSLKAWNDHGEASCQGKLICETLTSLKKRPVGDEYQGFDRIRRSGVPMPLPDKPMISALSDRRATISWMPYLGNPPTQPVTYHVEMCESPEGEWITVRTGIRGCGVDITNLLPKSDYKFRVRVANKHGVSEPSPYVMTYRHKLELPPINYEPKMDPNYDFRGDGPYVPEGFRINRDSHGNYYSPPRFLRLDHDTQYGLRGFNAYVKWYAYGYPLPKVRFLRDNKPIDVGGKGRFTYTQEATGEICLYIDRMTEADVGRYECIVTNEHGESRQRIKLALSEYPRVLQPLEEIHIKANSSGRIMCRISGYPPCDVKWFRDWEPITPSFRFRPMYSEPDWYILNINGASTKDAGLYSVAAVNVAGSVHSSCMVHVQEDNTGFYWTGPGMGRQVAINHRRGTLEDHYDVGDEIGRGTQGVVYHCVEHHTGRNFAAKSMWGKDNFKTWMRLEYEMMNLNNSCKQILRLYDAYEGPKNMVLVTHLCGGGDLLGALTQRQYLTEYEVCVIVRQVLLGLDYMHDHCIAHLGLNIGDLLLVRPNGLELKIGDLSLARQIKMNDLQPLDYGMPEFVAPEVANNEGVAFAADMWSVGIITYILLSGTSPFRGENDRETLTKVQKGEMNFDMEAFTHISDEAKDFIAKLLVFKADMRMDVKTALKHPWMDLALNTPRDPYRINTDRLRSYYSKFRDWYGNASCKRWYRRRTLASCFTHPSKMVYPPGEVYTPPESPEREILPAKPEDYEIPHRDYSYELDVIKNESNYQLGPDTYLLQLRDVEFPCRLRSYMKVASARSPSFAMSLRENDYDYSKVPVVHERRRFTDVMDEEIDDERRRTVLDKHTAKFIRGRMETCALDMPRRLKYEIPARLSIRDDPTGLQQEVCFGTPPFLREKPETVAITDGCPLTLTVVVTGDPEPLVQWFKNDIILGDSERVTIENMLGRSTLKYSECHEFDVGLYKVIARNQFGQATHKFRLVQGHIPGPCDCPGVTEVSDTEALVRWRAPIDDGGSQILCYHLQKKPAGETEWQTIAENIDHEFYLVRGLVPETFYQYRVAAKNFMGWAEFSAASAASRTTPEGVPKLEMSRGMQFLQQLTEKGKTVPPWPEKRDLDYSKEQEPVKLKTGENAQLQVRKYNMMAEISRGRFSLVVKCVRSDDHRQFVAKLLECRERDFAVREEFEVTKFLRHERIVQLYEAYCINNVTVFIMEPLAGVDILTYLAMQYEYSEQHVFLVVTQMLDALSYLHWRGFCHLDLQPDNIVLTTTRRCDVKLVDMGSVQKVSKLGSTVPVNGLLEYIAPEVLTEQQAFPNSDIWSLGAVAYMLLSGTSPFKGEDDQQTKDNIQFVRYRFETLASNTTQEAIRFFMLIFKRDPSKRPTVEECREHRWLTESDFMAKKRERATFFGNRLREYDLAYHRARVAASTKSSDLLNFNNANLPKAVSYDQEMLCTV